MTFSPPNKDYSTTSYNHSQSLSQPAWHKTARYGITVMMAQLFWHTLDKTHKPIVNEKFFI
jgi:hypothetical protein